MAAPLYLQAGDAADFPFQRKRVYYDAGCCYSLIGQPEQAFKYLTLAVKTYGYNNLDNITNDPDLKSLHPDPRWKPLVGSIKPTQAYFDDPLKATFVTTDVHNFWQAYDQIQVDTARRTHIYRDAYLAKASAGLQDYYQYKIREVGNFVKGHVVTQILCGNPPKYA